MNQNGFIILAVTYLILVDMINDLLYLLYNVYLSLKNVCFCLSKQFNVGVSNIWTVIQSRA